MENHFPLESQEQKTLVKWFKLQYPIYNKLLIAIPNGGYRNPREAKNLKDQGVMSGIPDLFLAIPNSNYCGLWIEMKRKGLGKLTKYQKEMHKILSEKNYSVVTAYGWEEAANYINIYLGKNHDRSRKK